MRVSNIKVEFSIPIKPNEPDLNGNVYTEEAIVNSLESYKNAPITIRDGDNIIPVGVINDAYISWLKDNSCVVCKGNLMFGGTDCLVSKSHRGDNGLLVVDEFTIVGVGVTQ